MAGEIAIYREAAGLEGITSGGIEFGWDTTVREDSLFSLTGGKVTCSETGHYLVMYNIFMVQPFPPPGRPTRAEVQSTLRINGTAINYGRGGTYWRNHAHTGPVAALCFGDLLSLTAGDDVALFVNRTDNAGIGGALSRAADGAGGSRFSLIRMDDSWDYLRLQQNANQAASSTAFTDLDFNVNDEISGSFSHSTSVAPEEVTINSTGLYLLFVSVGFLSSSSLIRVNEEVRVGINRQGKGYGELPGSRVTAYMRGANSCINQPANISILVTAISGDKLKVQYRHENSGTQNGTPLANKITWTMVALPSEAEYFDVLEAGGGQRTDTVADITFDTTSHEDVASFDHELPATPDTVTSKIEQYVLAFAGWYATTNGVRNTSRINTGVAWRVNGLFVGQTGEAGFGGRIAYSRGSPDSCEAYGANQVALLEDVPNSAALEFRFVAPGNGADATVVTSANSSVAQGINLGTMFTRREATSSDMDVNEEENRDVRRSSPSNIHLEEEVNRDIYRSVISDVDVVEEINRAIWRAAASDSFIGENASFHVGLGVGSTISLEESINRALWMSFNPTVRVVDQAPRFVEYRRVLGSNVHLNEAAFGQIGIAIAVDSNIHIDEAALEFLLLQLRFQARSDSAMGGAESGDTGMGGIVDEGLGQAGALLHDTGSGGVVATSDPSAI